MSRRRKNRLLQRLEYIAYRLVAARARKASHEALWRWGARLGSFTRFFARRRTRIAEENFRASFPERAHEAKEIIRECWRHMGREALTTIKMQGLTAEEIGARCDVVGDPMQGLELMRTHARDLCRALAAHIEFEERIVGMALADVIGWGGVLLAQLEAEHARQRANLASTLSAVETNELPKRQLVESVRALADAVLVDLESEERVLLTADLDEMADDSPGG